MSRFPQDPRQYTPLPWPYHPVCGQIQSSEGNTKKDAFYTY